MKKIILRILIGIGCVVMAFVLLIVAVLWPKFANMKSEYVTAGVIRDTRDFVVKTSGQWPQTWKDLGQPDLSRYTHMDFTINPATASESDIMKAITPQSQKYFTYPHAEADLRALCEEVTKYHSNEASQVVGAEAAPQPWR